ncbi:MAG: FAD-dependent oxidoreductase [Nitrospiraceae bacterium]|nr:FAD-dependent oxidoreductase [Nitrospiraceae bacterium]
MKHGNGAGRREFLTWVGGTAALTGYSLVVKADELGAPAASTPPARDLRETFDRIAPPADLYQRVQHEPNMRVVELECDFFVAGGGMAGVCAAIAAARNGARVVLAQDRSRLGGNASSEVRMHIVGADVHGGRSGWREGGILEELRLENAVRNPHGAWELWDLILYDKMVSEPHITLLLDSALYAAEVEGGQIREVLVRSDKTEHIYRIRAQYYADCTGDCRLGLEAGATIRTGHEDRQTFGEPLAPETAGPDTLGSSILFTSKDYGRPVLFTPPSWARKITKEQLQHRGTSSWEFGYWWIEWGGQRDAIHDNERIRFELLGIVMGVWDYIKNSGNHPRSENWGMDWVGMIPGKRASRRLDGPHVLTQQDLMGLNGAFEDAVAIGGWPFDDHPATGFDDPTLPPCDQIRIEDIYSIPLRALYSVNVDNLFMAGRNISMSHVAFSSLRVMGTCAAEGQAIGTAAAACLESGFLPKDLVADRGKLQAYRQRLLRDDQTIKDLVNADPLDRARSAAVSASSEIEGSRAQSVTNGLVRDMTGEWRNRWGGGMQEDGAWLELRWERPQTLSHIQLCFDSGFSRQLTLTESKAARKHQIWGPQPETVEDYRIEYRDPGTGGYTVLVEEKGNYQRLRRHRFDPVETDVLRIRVTRTHGAKEARIYEVRCYA